MDQKKLRSEYRYAMMIFKHVDIFEAPKNKELVVIGWKAGRQYGGPATRRDHQWFASDGAPVRVDWWARFPKNEIANRW